jgi:hypothetical protein
MELIQADLLAGCHQAGFSELERERLEVERQRLAARHKLLQAELDLVRSQREACRIRAPIDGRIVALHLRFPGMAVARGAELLKIAPTGGPYYVSATVPERNVDLLRLGTRARMESKVFDSIFDGPVIGVVERIAPEAQPLEIDSDTRREPPLYEVDIAVDETPPTRSCLAPAWTFDCLWAADLLLKSFFAARVMRGRNNPDDSRFERPTIDDAAEVSV